MSLNGVAPFCLCKCVPLAYIVAGVPFPTLNTGNLKSYFDSSMITIEEVQTNKQLRDFIKFPFSLYENNPYWVPPMLHDEMVTLMKNPAFVHCDKKYWVAKTSGKIAGRIAGIINHVENKNSGIAYARFGWLDFIDDQEVSKALLQQVENWAREHRLTHLHGPLGFTDLDKQGMLIEGYDELGTFATLYNHPYYLTHLEALGYRKSTDWVEFEITVPEQMTDRIRDFSAKVAERYGLKHLEAKNARAIRPYAGQVFDLINEAYSHLYGFVELNEQQVKFYTDQYFTFIKPAFVSLIVDQEDKVIAFGLTMPSLSRALQKAKGRLFPFGFIHILNALRKNDRADFYLIAIRKEYQRRGVHVMIFEKILNSFLEFAIKKVETNPELETNLQVQAIWKDYNPRYHKRRRCFSKVLSN